MKIHDKPLAAALRAARKRLGLSIREIARRGGMAPMGPCCWEKGRIPMALQLPAIAKAYKIPEETLWELRAGKSRVPASSPMPKSNGRTLFKRL